MTQISKIQSISFRELNNFSKVSKPDVKIHEEKDSQLLSAYLDNIALINSAKINKVDRTNKTDNVYKNNFHRNFNGNFKHYNKTVQGRPCSTS